MRFSTVIDFTPLLCICERTYQTGRCSRWCWPERFKDLKPIFYQTQKDEIFNRVDTADLQVLSVSPSR